MPLDNELELQTVTFGLLRWWERYDHLVLVGFNKGQGEFFLLDQRKVNEFIKSQQTFPKKDLAVLRAKILFKTCDPSNYMEARFGYCGTLEISKGAKYFRHFVFVTASGIEEELKRKFGYQVVDLNDLESATGHYHVRAVHHLITEYEAGRLVV